MLIDPTNEYSEKEKSIDLRHYLHVILKRRRVILAVLSVILVTVGLKTFTEVPIYRATTRLIIEKNISNTLSTADTMFDFWDQKFYNTHYEIIKSRTVSKSVIDTLQLDKSEEFSPKPKDDPISRFKRYIRGSLGEWKRSVVSLFNINQTVKNPKRGDDPLARLVSTVNDKITVSPVPESRIVDISFDAKDPVLAAVIVNAVAEAYINLNLETRLKSLKNAVEWLSNRISEERKKVNEAESARLKYKEKHGIITDFTSDTEQVTAQKLAQLNSQVVEAESNRVEAETLYNQAQALKGSPKLIDSIPDVLNNPLIAEIKTIEVDIYKRISELSDKYGKNHPRMVALNSELNEVRKRKAEEIERVINSLKNKYMVARAKENSLKEALEQQKQQALLLNEKAAQYSLLSREAESARELNDLLVQRFNEITMAEDLKSEYIRVVDKAEVPPVPISPNRPRALMLAALAGLVLGVGWAFFLEYLDNTIKSPEDLKEYMDVSFLGPVPAFQTNGAADIAGDLPPELICAHSPKSTTSEAYRGIRTNLMFSLAGAVPQVILTTSCAPQEGKSLTTANLAVTMAQAGSKTLVVDCDLRRPRMHKIFGVEMNRGLTTLLVGADGYKESILSTQIPGLDLIPSGPIPPDPSELLGSARMGDLLAALRKKYDRILIDSPPISAVTDAVQLSNSVDGVVLVVRSGSTVRNVAANGANQIKAVGGRILGAILNAVDAERDKYYYQNYYYHEYYGDTSEKRKKSRRERKPRSA